MGPENLYVGRAVCPHPENKHTPGKISMKTKSAYICYGGKEIEHKEYEALSIRY